MPLNEQHRFITKSHINFSEGVIIIKHSCSVDYIGSFIEIARFNFWNHNPDFIKVILKNDSVLYTNSFNKEELEYFCYKCNTKFIKREHIEYVFSLYRLGVSLDNLEKELSGILNEKNLKNELC